MSQETSSLSSGIMDWMRTYTRVDGEESDAPFTLTPEQAQEFLLMTGRLRALDVESRGTLSL